MRSLIVAGLATLTSISIAGPASPARTAGGLLTGTTQISFGCPGPVGEGTPSCNPWHPLGHARFSVTAVTTRFVVSGAQGQFTLRLPAGRYIVAPLPQPQLHTRGGPNITIRIRAGATTRIVVRFEGFPQMV